MLSVQWRVFVLIDAEQLLTVLYVQLTYLAQCPGTTCTGVSASTLKWVGLSV